ncbi:MAG: hypothetical protein LUD51_08185 [Clostridia bacterium]|nr:hypothetical protein [Clostridia bacterium]
MNFLKNFFKSKGVSYYLMAGAFVCGIVCLALYLTTGETEFTPTLDVTVTVAYVIFFVLALAMLIYEIRIVKFLTAAVGLYAFLMYIVFEVNYITNLLVSIDPTALNAGFVCILVFGLVGWLCALVSGCLTNGGFKKPKEMLS